MSNITTVQLVGIGGTPNGSGRYTYSAPTPDPKTSLPVGTYSITGSNLDQLSIDATTLSPGTYTVSILITDSKLVTAEKVITVRVVDPTLFSVLNESQNLQPSSFPVSQSIPLLTSGGSGAVTFTIIPEVTTLPGASILNGSLQFTVANYGEWTIGILATDSLGATANKVLQFSAENLSVYSLVDGQIEVMVNVPPEKAGVNQFTLSIADSNNSTLAQTFSYTAQSAISDIGLDEAFFDHYWGADDSTSIILPILGNLTGFTLATTTTTTDNGLQVEVDGANNVVKVSGSPSTFRNAEASISLVVLRGQDQIATITRQYTLLSHNGSNDIGLATCYTRPMIVGDSVGLNPLKPFFNSPNVTKPSSVTTRLQAGSALPPGLSLDATTGLIYGKLVDIYTVPSVVEYVDGTGAVVGTIQIFWTTRKSDFSLIDNLIIGQLQQTYTGSIASASSVRLSSVTTLAGRIPSGLTAQIDPVTGTTINLVGSPTEAGYFDIWFQVTNLNQQTAYLYRRLIVDYVPPLIILTSALNKVVTGQGYTQLLQGYGGIQPYTWALDPSSAALPTGLTLQPSGLISGTTTVTTYNQNLVLNLTDSRSPNVTTSAVLNLVVDNTLHITTATLPKIVPGQNYSFQMQVVGGTAPYTWALPNGFVLPSGIAFNTATGTFSGVTSQNFTQTLTISVTDSLSHVDAEAYTLQTGTASGILIDTTGVGQIARGAAYNGQLRVFGPALTVTTGVQWQVATDSPNPLPTGLFISPNAAEQGITAALSGTYSGVPLSNYPVKVFAVDNAGNSAQAFLLLTTFSSLKVTTTSLPQAIIGALYVNANTTPVQLQASGVNTPFSWSLAPGSPALPVGLSISTNGVITGSTSQSGYSQNVVVQVRDSLNDTATATLLLKTQASSLAISTTSLVQVTSGRSYSQQLTATGGVTPFTWAVAPSSAAVLPSGLSLNASTGAITGTTTASGFSKTITFQVTDNIGAVVTKALPMTVVSGLTLKSGIDYTDNTSTGYLGYVGNGSTDTINPRPNLSFYVVATGVVSTTASALVLSVGTPGFTASVQSLSSGVAVIRLSGNFAAGVIGDNSFTLSVTDSGVNVTQTLKWKVYDNGTLRLAPSTGTFPQQLITG